MPAGHVIHAALALRLRQPGQRRAKLRLLFRHPQHQGLAGPHLVGQRRKPLRQGHQRLPGRQPALLPARQDALQPLEVLRRLLQQRLHIGRHAAALAARIAEHAGGQPGEPRQPFLQLVIEAVLRLPGGQVEEAEHQRPGKPEHGGGKRRPHPPQRLGEPGLQLVEQLVHIPRADRHVADHIGDRTDRQQQPPEGAEQPEEDQQPRHVAGQLPRLVEPGGDPVQHAPHRRRRKAQPVGPAGGEHAGHRAEQLRRGLRRRAEPRAAEPLQPGDLRAQQQHLAQVPPDPEQQHAEDQPVQDGIGREGLDQHLLEQHGDAADHHQEGQHAPEEAGGWGHVGALIGLGAGDPAAGHPPHPPPPPCAPSGGHRCGWAAGRPRPAPPSPPGRGRG